MTEASIAPPGWFLCYEADPEVPVFVYAPGVDLVEGSASGGGTLLHINVVGELRTIEVREDIIEVMCLLDAANAALYDVPVFEEVEDE